VRLWRIYQQVSDFLGYLAKLSINDPMGLACLLWLAIIP
jgi:hypothetical protein